MILELRYLLNQLIQAILKFDAFLLITIPLALRLLQLAVHHFENLIVLFKVADRLLRLNLAILGRVRQPSHIHFQLIVLILQLFQQFRRLLLQTLRLRNLAFVPVVLFSELLKEQFLALVCFIELLILTRQILELLLHRAFRFLLRLQVRLNELVV